MFMVHRPTGMIINHLTDNSNSENYSLVCQIMACVLHVTLRNFLIINPQIPYYRISVSPSEEDIPLGKNLLEGSFFIN